MGDVGLLVAIGDTPPDANAGGWKKHPDAAWWVGGTATEAELRRKPRDALRRKTEYSHEAEEFQQVIVGTLRFV